MKKNISPRNLSTRKLVAENSAYRNPEPMLLAHVKKYKYGGGNYVLFILIDFFCIEFHMRLKTTNNKKKKNMNSQKTEHVAMEAQYIAPQVEIVELETTQSVLQGSIPEMPGENW